MPPRDPRFAARRETQRKDYRRDHSVCSEGQTRGGPKHHRWVFGIYATNLTGLPLTVVQNPTLSFLDRDKVHASFAADVPAEVAAFMADSQVPWGLDDSSCGTCLYSKLLAGARGRRTVKHMRTLSLEAEIALGALSPNGRASSRAGQSWLVPSGAFAVRRLIG
jgi:hypothetical protein